MVRKAEAEVVRLMQIIKTQINPLGYFGVFFNPNKPIGTHLFNMRQKTGRKAKKIGFIKNISNPLGYLMSILYPLGYLATKTKEKEPKRKIKYIFMGCRLKGLGFRV